VLANGSNQIAGFYSIFFMSKLSETAPGYFIVGSCP
jgi:poly(3-hydroxybutyrate) depolymerase